MTLHSIAISGLIRARHLLKQCGATLHVACVRLAALAVGAAHVGRRTVERFKPLLAQGSRAVHDHARCGAIALHAGSARMSVLAGHSAHSGFTAAKRIGPLLGQGARGLHGRIVARPLLASTVFAGIGVMLGVAINAAAVSRLNTQLAAQEAGVEEIRSEARREVNALAARLGELQAQANRLNALGDRLTRNARLGDGEFDFTAPVGMGGAEASADMGVGELLEGLDEVEARYGHAGRQLSVLEALLFDQELERGALPSRSPIGNSYITSGFGRRADPFGGGSQFHKGVDFDARHGDPVMAVADGVVTFAGVRSGYGNTVEVDHGNGLVTRYAHNSRNSVRVGDLVRTGQEVGKAGSSGRSTGVHVHLEVWENGQVRNPRAFLREIETRNM